ncbi:metal-dependent hydrolase family protein [Nocardia carnea]|uniref:metal-dependent hydrolase family protein n=1 Tax=Nocardia carnea TaxID=37328 RepID=UPI000307A502|nr:amidohydrolase family protein [Nocardia carnea]
MTGQIIEAARVLTGLGTALAPGTVVIDDRHIAWIGPAHELPTEWRGPGIDRIELPDATLLPGLIDTHVHLAFGGAARAGQDTDRDEIPAIVRAGLCEVLDAGITTVRDLGAPHYTDTDTLARPYTGPRVLTATIPLTVPGGHCHQLGGATDTVAGIHELVAANAARDADWIKIMVTGGFTTGGASSPYEPQFTDTQITAAVTAAHEHGLPVAAHAHGTAGIRQAVTAGVDSIEHCTWMTRDGFDLDPGLVREIADRRIPVCPTLNHLARSATGRLPWPVRRHHLQIMLDTGVRLIPGSDAGIPHTPPGRYPDSLPAYTDLGLTPAEVIDLATRQAADALRIGHLTGTLAAGHSADLLAVPGDPTRDLDLLTAPTLIAAAGRLHYTTATPDDEEKT